MKNLKSYVILFLLTLSALSCNKESVSSYVNTTTPSPLQIPQLFESLILNPIMPPDNPQTEEGIFLGRKLFYDPLLSADNTQACASCHNPANAFTDSNRFSEGIDGFFGDRNAMPLFNLAWNYEDHFSGTGVNRDLKIKLLSPLQTLLKCIPLGPK